jgi:hypothetical protein
MSYFKLSINKIINSRILKNIEFLGQQCQKLFKENHIVYRSKIGQNKAFLAEHYIFIVKKYLYKTLRGTLNKNWVLALEKVVTDMNNTQLKRIGYLTPNQINSEIDSAIVRSEQKKHNIIPNNEPNWQTQLQNQEEYKSNSTNIQIGIVMESALKI